MLCNLYKGSTLHRVTPTTIITTSVTSFETGSYTDSNTKFLFAEGGYRRTSPLRVYPVLANTPQKNTHTKKTPPYLKVSTDPILQAGRPRLRRPQPRRRSPSPINASRTTANSIPPPNKRKAATERRPSASASGNPGRSPAIPGVCPERVSILRCACFVVGGRGRR